jgi:putative acetyltransferase
MVELARARPRVLPPEGVEIRRARPSDARAYLAHWREVIGEGNDLRAERVDARPAEVRRRLREDGDDLTLLAVSGDRVLGSLALVRERHPATRHVATFEMAVAADARRRGIGSALLAAACDWASARGVEKLLLSVYPDNIAAIALYRRFGFSGEGRLTGQSRTAVGYVDEILMAVWLREPAGRPPVADGTEGDA